MISREPDTTEIATRARRYAEQLRWLGQTHSGDSVELALERAFIAGAQFVLDEMKVLRK